MNKRMLVVFGVILLFTLNNALYAQTTVSLDEAIRTGAGEIEDVLSQGVKVAVLNFNSSSPRFSNYVLDEMITALVKGRKLTVVTRAELELLQQEENFQLSGAVSDESQQSIAGKLGAQSIVSGNIEDMGTYYRIRFRTIEQKTAALQTASSINVRKDNYIANLMGEKTSIIGGGGNAFAYGAMNIAFGLGSYLQGDVVGGVIITSGYAVSVGLIIWELAGLTYEDALAGIPGSIGLGLAGATLVFGFIKPILYDRNPNIASVTDRVNIVPVSDGQRVNALQISYTYSF